jgi:SOS-response transcriptional repressor LexA
MEWWERLGRRMQDQGLKAPEVAKRARVNVKSLYGYLQGLTPQPRGDAVKRLAQAVGLSEIALRHGNDVGQVTVQLKRIPLLSMDKVGTLTPSKDPIDLWDGTAVVSAPIDVSEGSYGMMLRDDANGPDKPAGSIIICDPNAELVPGQWVVAVLTDEKEAHFGRYRPASHGDKKRFTLVRDNDDYPDIEVGTKHKGFVLSRVVKHIRDL